MRATKIVTAFLVAAILFNGCDQWNLDTTDFVEVSMMPIDSISTNEVALLGNIEGLTNNNASDHGFIWSVRDVEPTIFSNDGNISLGALKLTEQGPFKTEASFAPSAQYRIRAFAIVDGQDYYSESKLHETGTGSVETLAFHYEKDFSIDLSGTLSGTELGIVAVAHGFCWSTTDPRPTIMDEQVNLGNSRTNEVFNYRFEGLQNNAPHHFRAYAIFSFNFNLDTIYGSPVSFDGDLNFWERLADFPGPERDQSFSFSIGDKGYIGMGNTGQFGDNLVDLWEYDAGSDTWTKKADFPGFAQSGFATFTVGTKAYLATGTFADEMYYYTLTDVWEYDTVGDIWTQLPDFPGQARFGAVGFSVGDKGYLGMGVVENAWSEPLTDFWEFDPNTNTWTQKASFPDFPRYSPLSFSIDNRGYMVTNSGNNDDIWSYDPRNNQWAPVAGLPEWGLTNLASTFFLKNQIYLVASPKTNRDLNGFWHYDSVTDQWHQLPDFPGLNRQSAISFSIGDKGYFGTGYSLGEKARLKDFWVYDP